MVGENMDGEASHTVDDLGFSQARGGNEFNEHQEQLGDEEEEGGLDEQYTRGGDEDDQMMTESMQQNSEFVDQSEPYGVWFKI